MSIEMQTKKTKKKNKKAGCYICKDDISINDKLIKPCSCESKKAHINCLKGIIQDHDDDAKCEDCENPYRMKIRKNRKFSCWKFGKLTIYCLLGLIYLGFLVFLAGGTTFLPIEVKSLARQPLISSIFPIGPYSEYPGLLLLDIMYFAFSLTSILFLPIIGFLNVVRDPESKNLLKEHKLISVGTPILSVILLHLFGNFHFFFWGTAANVIPEDKRFFMFDYHSFYAGPAGLILFGLMVGVLGLIGYGCYMLYKYCYQLNSVEEEIVEIV